MSYILTGFDGPAIARRMSRTLALAVCLAPLSCCVPHREVLERGLTASRDLAVAAEPCLVATRQAQLDACSADAECLEQVRTSYAKLADSLDALHAAWCVLSPAAEGCS